MKKIGSNLDLVELEKKVDAALDSWSEEDIKSWLIKNREKNKGIIIMGSIGSGKTHFEEELCKWSDFQEPRSFNRIDSDIWVENEDSEFYNNPLKASNYLNKIVLPNIMEMGQDFILQSTGSNTKTIKQIIDYPNYEFKIVVVYCNPIISFLRNFSRERKCPKQIVLENWLKVYSNIEEYREMVGEDNIYIYETEYTPKEKTILNKYKCLWDFFDNNPGANFMSSFRKGNKIYTKEQLESKEIDFNKIKCNIDYFLKHNKQNILTKKEYIKQQLSEWILI